MFCPNCGKQLSEESMFCGNCGTAVSKIPVTQEPMGATPPVEEPPIVETPPAQPPVDMAATQPIPTQEAVPQPQPSPVPENIDETMAFAPYMGMDPPQPSSLGQDLPEEQKLFQSAELPPIPEDLGYQDPYQQQVSLSQDPSYIPPNQGPVLPEQAPVYPVQEPDAPPAPKQKNVAIIVLLGVLCGLVLALAIYFVCLMFPDMNLFGSGDEKEETSSQQEKKEDKEKEEKEPVTLSEDNKYAPYFSEEQPYILKSSDTVYYGRKDLMKDNKLISLNEMNLALQEIYARHGETFDDEDLQEYFNAQPWYEETNGSYSLNECEKANELLLKTTISIAENTVQLNRNPYLAYIDDTDFTIPYTSTDYIHKEDVNWLNGVQLLLVKNTIYARKGYIFEDSQMQEYFYCMDWYAPDPKVDVTKEGTLNHFEDSNSKVLDVWIRREEGVDFSPTNPYLDVFDNYYDYVFKYSNSSELNPYAVYSMSLEELCIARNEILARHGYTFTDEELLEYFLQRSWYQPTLPPGDSSEISLTAIEKENIAMIQDAEAQIKALNNLDTTLSYAVSGTGYSLKLPAYWRTNCVQKSEPTYLRFYEKQSYNSAGGHLFTFCLFSPSEDYQHIPNYRLVGYLEDSNGVVQHLVAVFPSDVQFDAQSATMYNKMYDEFDRIITTITPNSGYTFTKA